MTSSRRHRASPRWLARRVSSTGRPFALRAGRRAARLRRWALQAAPRTPDVMPVTAMASAPATSALAGATGAAVTARASAEATALDGPRTGRVPAPFSAVGPLLARRWDDAHRLGAVPFGWAEALGAGGLYAGVMLATEELMTAGLARTFARVSMSAAVLSLLHRFRLPWRRWEGRRVPLADRLGDTSPGRPVRLVGCVEARDLPAPLPDGGARRVVYLRLLVHEGPQNWREDVRATPFSVRLEDGALVHVDPDDLLPLDRPRRVRDLDDEALDELEAPRRSAFGTRPGVLANALHVGDRVELVGRLEPRVDPQGEAAAGRGPRLVQALTPLEEGRVLIWTRG